ncbi:MAG: GldG family protein [Proteobacteria bacterium]|nr:GldG family protein [Pseudomonadota bacterium]
MNNKRLALLFVTGMICLAGGFVSLYVEQGFGVLAIALSLAGLISLLICFFYKGGSFQRHLTLPQWKKAGIILALIFLSAVFSSGINYFAYSFPFRWDVTQAKQHTLTTSTIEFLEGLKSQVQLTALYVGLPPKYLEDMFNEYERVSNGNIKTEIVDPIERIGYAAQFGSVISAKERKVIVRAGNERRDLDFTQSALSEEQLTNALVRVAREERHVYFLTGHGEFTLLSEESQGLSLFAKLLDSNNIVSKNLILGIEGNIPEDCDVLIIAGPHNDLTQKEEAMIEEYLKKGGNALFLIEQVVVTKAGRPLTDEEKHKNPSLNSILNQWGINIQEDIVVDLSSHAGSDVGSPATRNYMRHKAITEGLDYTFYVRPRSITVLRERRSSIKLAPIVLTATEKNSWAETNRSLEIHFDETVDAPGPVPISFVIWEEKEEGDHSDTRIIVFTDADFLTNVYINQYSNAKMGLNIINWLSELDYKVFLDQKEIKVERLDLTSKQRREIAAILFLMPLFIAVGGIVVWMKS